MAQFSYNYKRRITEICIQLYTIIHMDCKDHTFFESAILTSENGSTDSLNFLPNI